MLTGVVGMIVRLNESGINLRVEDSAHFFHLLPDGVEVAIQRVPLLVVYVVSDNLGHGCGLFGQYG